MGGVVNKKIGHQKKKKNLFVIHQPQYHHHPSSFCENNIPFLVPTVHFLCGDFFRPHSLCGPAPRRRRRKKNSWHLLCCAEERKKKRDERKTSVLTAVWLFCILIDVSRRWGYKKVGSTHVGCCHNFGLKFQFTIQTWAEATVKMLLSKPKKIALWHFSIPFFFFFFEPNK